MNKVYPFFLLLCLLSANLLFAQSYTQGCDGVRYLEDVFPEVTKTTVKYGENTNVSGQNQQLFMDVYEPAGDEQEMRPVILLAFGGSFIFGDRSLMEEDARYFARKGYVAASIDYRLWPLFQGFPDSTDILDVVVQAVGDMKAAIRHFRKDADTDNAYRVDPNFVFVGGYSAGAIVATHTACLGMDDEISDEIMAVVEANGGIEGTSGDAENLSYSSAVSGVLNLSGALHRKAWLDADDAPIASFHGTSDSVVPFEHGVANGIISVDGSGRLKERAEEVGVGHLLVSVEGGGHSDIYSEANFLPVFDSFRGQALSMFNDIMCAGAPVGTEELTDVSRQVKTFPNPSGNTINVKIENVNTPYTLRVFDQLGRVVQAFPIQENQQTSLRKSDMGTGWYVVEITFDDLTLAPVRQKIVFY